MSQTSVSASGQAIGVAGQVFDNAEVQDIVSGFSEETSLQIAFGTGVMHGTADQGVVTAATGGGSGIIMGVSVFGFNHFPANAAGTIGDLGTTGVLPKGGLQVMRKGRILAKVGADVTSITPYTARGFLQVSTNGNNVAGDWVTATDASNVDATKQAQFVSSLFTAADGTTKVAVLEVDFTNKP